MSIAIAPPDSAAAALHGVAATVWPVVGSFVSRTYLPAASTHQYGSGSSRKWSTSRQSVHTDHPITMYGLRR